MSYPADCSVVPAHSIDIPDFKSFAFRYDVMEFNTAVKPYMFSNLFNCGYDQVIYFDPDIEVFSRLDVVLDALDNGAGFVFTPHLTMPNEGDVPPDDITIMRAGIYNLGFLGVGRSEETERIIRWWSRRLRYQCINDQSAGIFVDQKFMDLVPGFVSNVAILRNPTTNIAYWNLTQRHLDQSENGWTVDGKPLGFFHFSGFNPKTPNILSKHTPLFRTEQPAPLLNILDHYGKQLLNNGYGTIPNGAYAYGKFSSGVPVPDSVRRMFRETHPTWVGDPFDNYEEYLHLPSAQADGNTKLFCVTNFMRYLWASEPYLRSTFNIQDPSDVERFVVWYINHGAELGLDPRLIEPVAERAGRRKPHLPHKLVRWDQRDPRPDVSVVGYLRTASGVGEAGRLTLEALTAAKVRTRGYDIALNVASPRNDERCSSLLSDTVDGRVQIFNINADQLPLVMQSIRPAVHNDAYRIAIPFWELSVFPDAWIGALESVDEIWAPTRFIQAALVKKLVKPVVRMPISLTLPTFDPLPRSYFSLPEDKFIFFFSFDFLSFVERKNPRAAVQAFKEAFRRRHHRSDVALVLKSINGSLANDELVALCDEFKDDPDVIMIDRALSRAETLSLINASDAVISLHRSEGLGLLVAEAMALGKPVVATDYSATTELVTPRTGYPVDYRLVPLQAGQYPFWQNQVWADPDIGHAAWQMRAIVTSQEEAQKKAAYAKQYLKQNYGVERVGALERQRLVQLGLL
jgi:glycosyltransferase involved in cell wall biosynthesis